MRQIRKLMLIVAAMSVSINVSFASTAYGDLNNFDTINDTGHPCHGFEIELDDVKSIDITYTYDFNHYGAPVITQDDTDPLHPKTFVRYLAKTKDLHGNWVEFTNAQDLANPIAPNDCHMCTDPSVNAGCEHFGVGYYGVPTAIKYHWLVDNGGSIITSEPVNLSTPTWVYTPPVSVDPLLPPDPIINPIVQPAQVVAAIPAPIVPNQEGKNFGIPTWVKVIKTKTHNNKNIPLKDLVGPWLDKDGKPMLDMDGKKHPDWTNAIDQENVETETETEWTLLQTQTQDIKKPAKQVQPGLAENLDKGDETITRRYEFYAYGADDPEINPNSLSNGLSTDGENGEAMCDEVNPTTDKNSANYLHGVSSQVQVTNANGNSYTIDCSSRIVVGKYIGSQMAGFDLEANLGLVDNLQDGTFTEHYVPRTIIVGGNTPYRISIDPPKTPISGAIERLPSGMSIGDYIDPQTNEMRTGVLWGNPSEAGTFTFNVIVTDQAGVSVNKDFTLTITAPKLLPNQTLFEIGSAPINLNPLNFVTIQRNSKP